MRRGRMAIALGKSVCWKNTMAAVHQQIASSVSTMRRSSRSMPLGDGEGGVSEGAGGRVST